MNLRGPLGRLAPGHIVVCEDHDPAHKVGHSDPVHPRGAERSPHRQAVQLQCRKAGLPAFTQTQDLSCRSQTNRAVTQVPKAQFRFDHLSLAEPVSSDEHALNCGNGTLQGLYASVIAGRRNPVGA